MNKQSLLFGSLWLSWLVFFCIVEAFGRGKDQQLTDWVWWATNHSVVRFPFFAFLVWLIAHLVFRLKA